MPIIPSEKKSRFENHTAKIGGKISEYPKDKEME